MKGIYCLLINIKKNISLKIGSLGKINFKKGNYVYVGSAQNGIGQRVSRHLSKDKKIRWHIDYLLNNPDVYISKIFYKKASKKQECKTACFLSNFSESIKDFGCSDCNCNSHLFRLNSLKNINKLNMEEFKNAL